MGRCVGGEYYVTQHNVALRLRLRLDSTLRRNCVVLQEVLPVIFVELVVGGCHYYVVLGGFRIKKGREGGGGKR